ncbi:hypothetical protein Scep_023301 [Stephania cephalantha]|uniref:Clavata3/ESR (CLE) gene family member n=1 Tax=Stephania cephalantha TaxID=152367 RepID=A0AAP0HX63_9MAGN
MKGRLIGLVLVLGLALLACDGSAREIFFNGRLSHNDEAHHLQRQKQGSRNSDTLKSSYGSSRIGVKGGVVHGLLFKNSKNTTLDDKRVVPTGPNPLHNR